MPGIHSHFKHRGTNRLLELNLTQVNSEGRNIHVITFTSEFWISF